LIPAKKTAVIWGDSVVFGVNNGWVDQINGTFENYQFLNGGIEGDSPDNIVNRAIKKNNELDIELNILFPGWHQLEDYDLFVDSMGQAVKHLENLVLCTVPFALSPALASQDISAHFNEFDLKVLELEEGTNECFLFWGTLPYSIENAEMITRNITERNHIIREFAQKLHIPLIDLAEKFHNEDITKLTEVFFDVGHPRPSAYPLFAEAIKEGLTDVIK
jgi:lysophospholipase L1-like esterase